LDRYVGSSCPLTLLLLLLKEKKTVILLASGKKRREGLVSNYKPPKDKGKGVNPKRRYHRCLDLRAVQGATNLFRVRLTLRKRMREENTSVVRNY